MPKFSIHYYTYSLEAGDGSYIPSDEANERIEHLTTANQELLERVSTVAKEVKTAIERVKEDKAKRRK